MNGLLNPTATADDSLGSVATAAPTAVDDGDDTDDDGDDSSDDGDNSDDDGDDSDDDGDDFPPTASFGSYTAAPTVSFGGGDNSTSSFGGDNSTMSYEGCLPPPDSDDGGYNSTMYGGVIAPPGDTDGDNSTFCYGGYNGTTSFGGDVAPPASVDDGDGADDGTPTLYNPDSTAGVVLPGTPVTYSPPAGIASPAVTSAPGTTASRRRRAKRGMEVASILSDVVAAIPSNSASFCILEIVTKVADMTIFSCQRSRISGGRRGPWCYPYLPCRGHRRVSILVIIDPGSSLMYPFFLGIS